jgi:Spy/CpxP family protein refolding chaperone
MKIKHLILPVVLVAGLVSGGAVMAHDGNDGHGGGCHDGRDGKHEKMNLPDAKRELLHNTMKAAFEKNKGLMDQMHKLHEKMHAIVSADNFNPQAFESTSAQIEKLHDRIHKIRTDAFASIANQFTPEEREMILRHHHHHHHGHDGMHHHDGWDRHGMNDGGASGSPMSPDYPPYPSR